MERESERGKPTAAEEQEWTSRGCKRVCVSQSLAARASVHLRESLFTFSLCFSDASLLPLFPLISRPFALCSCATLASECLAAASTRDS